MRRRALLAVGILAIVGVGTLFAVRTLRPANEDMIFIPAGDFLMGSDRVDTEGKSSEFGFAKPLYLDEHPQQSITLPDYWIDRYEVTQAAYAEFVAATGSPSPKHWVEGRPPPGQERFPVTAVDWYEAQRYCGWKGKRLPTEAEWEKAARGTDGREFPWGSDYDGQKANTGDAGRGGLVAVGSFPQGLSPYGVEDMAGNAWEWTSDWYLPYLYGTYRSQRFGRESKVLRGGGWGGVGHNALPEFYRSAHRFPMVPAAKFADFGFRCVKSR